MVLLLSLVFSLVIWSFLFSFKLALALIAAIFIHEYGHFWWMGKEGIKKKIMFFMPPFGAVAMAKEPWTSYGAEMRIALAGPAAGLISVLLFYLLWLFSGRNEFMASVILACLINLFNLMLPIPILDGGRVIKSILFSIHRILGDIYYAAGFAVLIAAFYFGLLNIVFVGLIGFLLYREWDNVIGARRQLVKVKEASPGILKAFGAESDIYQNHKKIVDRLETFVNMKKMRWPEAAIGLFIFAGIVLAYIGILHWANGYMEILKFHNYLK